MARTERRRRRMTASLRAALATLLLLAAAVPVLAVSVLAGPALAREFRAADAQPADYPTVQGLRLMAGLVHERSGGRHSIRVFDSAQLGQEVDTVGMTRAGVIDLDRLNIATFNDSLPETIVPALPYLFRDEDHLRRVLDGPVGAAILAAFSRLDMVALAFFETSPRSFYTVNAPLRTPADFRGLRLRVLPTRVIGAMVETLGATAVYLPFRQVTTALTTGLIDGAENTWPSYRGVGHARLAKYYTLTRHTYSPSALLMSRRSWDGLDAADRELFRTAAREAAETVHRLGLARDAEARAAAAADGITVVEADGAALAAAVRPVYDTFAADPVVRELLARVREVP